MFENEVIPERFVQPYAGVPAPRSSYARVYVTVPGKFEKARVLYNLHRAKEGIRKNDRVLLVEGYMDVIGVWAAGVREVVAPCGTSFTAQQIKLLKAGILGEPNGRPDSDPEVQRLLFESMARSADTAAVNGHSYTFQFRFSDADPWHLVIDNGSTRVEPGEAAHPDLTVDTDWEQWINVTTRGGDPLRALIRRRIRPHGRPRGLNAFRKLFRPR